MPIENTVRLSIPDIALMNTTIRRIGSAGSLARGPGVNNGLITDDEIIGEPKPTTGPDPQGRRIGLAEHFGLKPLSVVAWLVPDSGTSFPAPRACVTVRDGRIGNNPPYVGALGRRIYCLQPTELAGTTDPLNSLRQRIFLCAVFCPGGLQRIPIYHGETRERRWGFGMLSDALNVMLTEWSGQDNFFAERAWIQFTVFGKPGNWTLSMFYNLINPSTDVSDKMEQEDDGQDNGAQPGCP